MSVSSAGVPYTRIVPESLCFSYTDFTAIPAPTADDPIGLEPGAPFFVLGRSYLEPRTLVRPSSSEIVPHQVFLGSRK